MSLQVWLPLNGDLKNQGLSDINIYHGSTPIYSDTGKIGKCFTMNTYVASDNFTLLSSGIFSISYWVKYTEFPQYNEYCISINETSSSDCLIMLGVQNTDGKLSVNARASGTLLSLNNWYHITYTCDGIKGYLYLNGALIKTYSSVTMNKNATKLTINGRYGSCPTHVSKSFLNDVRIYDHCLSPKEVKEISKALVLHYPLNDLEIETTTNLLSAAQSCQNPTNLQVGQYVASIADSIATVGNSIITYSAYIKNTSSVRVCIRCSPLLIAGSYGTFHGNYIEIGQEGWSSVTVDISDTSKYNGQIYLYFQNGSAGTNPTNNTIIVQHVQVEAKNHRTAWTLGGTTRNNTIIYDCSISNINDGTIVGAYEMTSDSPRNSHSLNFTGSAGSIAIGNLSTMIPEGVFTFNIWFKKKTGEWSTKGWETILGGPSGFELEGKTNNTSSLNYIHLYSWGGGGSNLPNDKSIQYELDKWNMLTFVRTTSGSKCYLNGELKCSASAGSIPSGNYYLGAWNTAIQQNYRGLLSDARIYATELSAEDILELYHTAAIVDNQGNTYAYEFIE